MQQIYTYSSINHITSYDYWEEIRNLPCITVYQEMASVLPLHSISFHQLIKEALPDWNTDQTKFSLSVCLSRFLSGLREKYINTPDYYWYQGCCKNIDQLLSSIILLEEAEVNPKDLAFSDEKNIHILMKAWEYLRECNPILSYKQERMVELTWREAWGRIFETFNIHEVPNKLIVCGFYYFTPLQQHIFDLLEHVGVELVYLIPYRIEEPWVYEIWSTTYFMKLQSIQECYTSDNSSGDQTSKVNLSNTESAYENTINVNSNESIKKLPDYFKKGSEKTHRSFNKTRSIIIQEYNSSLEFIKACHPSNQQGGRLYSSNDKQANKLLQDFYPESYGKRRLLAYPIGQFVGILNSLWNHQENEIRITTQQMIDLFATGWLAYEGKSGKSHVHDVMKLMPYFRDCERMEEWRVRLKELRRVYQEVILGFRVGAKEKRVVPPMEHMPYFSVGQEELEVILRLIERILEMAQELFVQSEEMFLVDYVRKLEQLLFQYEMSNELYEEERILIEELFLELGKPYEFDTLCRTSDLSTGLRLFLEDKLSEGELQLDQKALVAPLYQVEAQVAKGGKVHICYSDVEHLPGPNKQYVWPLTEQLLLQCYKLKKNAKLQNIIYIMKVTPLCNRYFVFSSLSNEVKFSWIRDVGHKLLSASPYIPMIEELYAERVVYDVGSRLAANKHNQQFICNSVEFKDFHVDSNLLTNKQMKESMERCPLMYFYGYVLDFPPTSTEESQESNTIQQVLLEIRKLVLHDKISKETVFQHIIELFPMLKHIEKSQIYDEWMDAITSRRESDGCVSCSYYVTCNQSVLWNKRGME